MDNQQIYILIQLELEKPAIRITNVNSNLEDFDNLFQCLCNISEADFGENRKDKCIFPNGNYLIEICINNEGLHFNSPFNIKNTQALCGLASAYLLLCEEVEGPPA